MTNTRSTLEQLDPNFTLAQSDDGLCWYDVRGLGVEGRGWADADLETPYDRLPARAKGVVRDPVWQLAQHSSGMWVRFVTDATGISARWSLRFEALAMPHMPATGVSGLDLYAFDPATERWRWCGNGAPRTQADNSAKLIDNLQPGVMRLFMLYLPLYNGVTSVAVGLPAGSVIAKAPAWRTADPRPICFYGTSIVQGGCASRTGMAYPAILGRRLCRPTINLGFSGNGKLEPEVARLLAELDPSVYVLDPLPNNVAESVHERMGAFVTTLRDARPDTPIVFVESITYQAAWLNGNQRHVQSNAALRQVYRQLCDAGVTGLSYIEGHTLLGDDDEATVDGTHATDVGFSRMASAIETTLRDILR